MHICSSCCGHIEAECKRGLPDPLPLPTPTANQEAGLLASLRHNNVVNFYGVCHSPPCIITGAPVLCVGGIASWLGQLMCTLRRLARGG